MDQSVVAGHHESCNTWPAQVVAGSVADVRCSPNLCHRTTCFGVVAVAHRLHDRSDRRLLAWWRAVLVVHQARRQHWAAGTGLARARSLGGEAERGAWCWALGSSKRLVESTAAG